MALARTPSYTTTRWHYALLLLAPLPRTDTSPTQRADAVTLRLLLDQVCGEWFGVAGGVGGGEVELVSLRTPGGGAACVGGAGEEAQGQAREAVVRFPAGATHPLLTALPLSTPTVSGQAYRIRVLADSADLQRLAAGLAGKGRAGYKTWVGGFKGKGVKVTQKVQDGGEEMVEG
ncbi:hypothetical protein JCM10213_003099 [Rhodosporidiobolus nylandii]